MKNTSADVSWVDRVQKRYKELGILIPPRQEHLYRAMSRTFAPGRTVVDIGCSTGVGTNILSHGARHVWGVDINEEAIDFATKAFARPNMNFDVYDIEKPPTRSHSPFEMVVMSEILEHVEQPELALNNVKRFFHERTKTIGFITCPNQVNAEVRENEKKHGFHLHKWNAGEFYELMTTHFNAVVMYSAEKVNTWQPSETVDGSSEDYLIVAKVEGPK